MFKLNRYVWLWASLFFFVVILVVLAFYSGEKKSTLYKYDYLKPFLFSFGVDDSLYKEIISGSRIDPLGASVTAISYFYYGFSKEDKELSSKGVDIVNSLKSYPFKRVRNGAAVYLYDQPHDDWAARTWWSGMSNASIALAYTMAYDYTRDEEYKELALASLRGVTNKISDNGSSIIFDDGSKWFEEYVDDSTDESNARFVLNGFTFSLVALRIIGDYLEDENILAEYKLGLKGFELKAGKFYDSGDWIYYMLNPATIESMHYSVFDFLLIKTLYVLEEDNKFLLSEIEKREGIFKKKFGLRTSGDGLIYFSAIGVPYPYWVDIYPGKFLIKYKNGAQHSVDFKPLDRAVAVHERTFKNLACCDLEEIEKIEVFQEKNNIAFHLFTIKPGEIPSDNDIDYLLGHKKYRIDDSVISGGTKKDNFTYIPNSNGELRVRLVLDDPLLLLDGGVSLVSYSFPRAVKSIQLILIDVNGKAISSYYPVSKFTGDGAVVFLPIGFKGGDSFGKLKELRLYVSIADNEDVSLFNVKDVIFNLSLRDLNSILRADYLVDDYFLNIPFRD